MQGVVTANNTMASDKQSMSSHGFLAMELTHAVLDPLNIAKYPSFVEKVHLRDEQPRYTSYLHKMDESAHQVLMNFLLQPVKSFWNLFPCR